MKSVTVWIRFARRASPSTWAYLVPMEHRRTPEERLRALPLPVIGPSPSTSRKNIDVRNNRASQEASCRPEPCATLERPPSVHRRSDVELKAGNCGMDAVDHIRAGRREFCCR